MNTIIYAGKHQLTLDVPRHIHASWEIIYCTEGSGAIKTGNGELPYKVGDVAVIPPNFQHGNHSDTGFKNYHVNMTDMLLPFDRPCIIHADEEGLLLNAIAAAYYHYTSGGHSFLAAYGTLIYAYLAASQDVRQLSSVVERIKSNIIHNFQNPAYELDEYLHSFPFSYDYMRKLFKKEVGITPHQYLSETRLQTAANLLISGAGTDINISEISRCCGFKEPLYFSRMFKQQFGVAPREYRENANSTATPILDGNALKILIDDEGNKE